jgi:hypothetical protein
MDKDQLYRDYMTIVFGLVASKGLEQLAERALHRELSWSQAPFFLGAFIVGIHYWYACVFYAGISRPTYDKISENGSSEAWKNIKRITLFGVPVLFVSAYAGSVVMFFYSIPGRYDLLFRAFWVLLLTSSINDIWNCAVTAYARKGADTNLQDSCKSQLNPNAKWIGCDLVYFLVFFFWLYSRVVSLSVSCPFAAGMVFLGLIGLGVVLDACITAS